MTLLDDVRELATGSKSDYRLSPSFVLPRGGQADVFEAIHKPTGAKVAFKRLRGSHPVALARMRREIIVGKTLEDHPNVVPILDADHKHRWFVMPWAEGNAMERQQLLADDEAELRRFVESVAVGLRVGHEKGWVHRDVKPANVLYFLDSSLGIRWAVADWGLVRRPPGDTSEPGRTRAGEQYGTEGFAAPELSVDAHSATAAADIYSLGQLIGWAITGAWPQANIPLVPSRGAWRQVVREATRLDPVRRPKGVDSFLDLVATELDEPPSPPGGLGEDLLDEFRGGSREALFQLFTLAEKHQEDERLYIDVLPQLDGEDIRSAAVRSPTQGREIATAFARHVDSDWGHRSFSWANEVIRVPLDLARAGEEIDDLDLVEDAFDAVLEWDEGWDQWNVQKAIRAWLRSLSGDVAQVVARVIRRHPRSGPHFSEILENARLDPRIRAALEATQ